MAPPDDLGPAFAARVAENIIFHAWPPGLPLRMAASVKLRGRALYRLDRLAKWGPLLAASAPLYYTPTGSTLPRRSPPSG